MNGIRMIQDCLLVKEDAKVESFGKIIIPDKYRENVQTGMVMVAGPGFTTGKKQKPNDPPEGVFIKTTVKPGDKIIYGKHGGSNIEFKGKQYLVINERWVWGIIPKEK
jgi:chaperonin GroES